MPRRRSRVDTPMVRPFDVDGVRTVAVGTVLWALAFVVLALNRDALDEQDRGWWLWTCLAGVGLGLLGLEYTRKRRDAIARARLFEEADRPDEEPVTAAEGDEPAADAVEAPDAEAAEAEPSTEPERQSARIEWEPEPAGAAPSEPEPKPAVMAPEPEPEPTAMAPEPEPVATAPEPELDPESESATMTELAETDLLDLESPASTGRRARRAPSSVNDSTDDLDEPLLPFATGDLDTVSGRRARRSDLPDDDEISDDDATYRGRRARRP